MPMRFKDKIEGTITNADYASSAGSVAWSNVSGKPSTFAPASHTHNYAGSSSAGGSANSAVKLDTATAGSTTQPVYFSGGKPVAIGYTIQSSVPANAKFTDTNTTYDVFKAATASAAGGTGLVPAPAAGQQNYFLRGDKTWQALSKSSVGLGNVDNTADSAKSVKYATSAGSANAVAWSNVSGKPTTFSPASHTHKYASGFSVSGTTVTVSYGDGTSSTFTTQDTNTTYNVFKAATASAAGGTGLVPAPTAGAQGYYLAGDSTWKAFSKSTVGLGNVDNTADSAKSVKYATSAGSVAWSNVSGKPSTFTPASHTHKYASGFSVSGTTVTVSYGDGTSSTFKTQDTNTTYTDMKGATSSAAGTHGLVPAPAAGAQTKYLRGDGTWQTLSKYTIGLGNVDNTADSAKKVNYAEYAGEINPKNSYGSITKAVRPMFDSVRANRLAFLPSDQIIVEKTVDGGKTWTDAAVTDYNKRALFSENGGGFTLPQIDGKKNTLCGIRLTITGMKYNVPAGTAETAKYNYWNSKYVKETERYCTIGDMFFWVSSGGGSDNISLVIERATGGASTNWENLFESSNSTGYLTGWSGPNYIKFNEGTLGGGTGQTSNYWNYRFTFMTHPGNGSTFNSNYITNRQDVMMIKAYGESVWNSPNSLMSNDHMYTWDVDKNVTFPAKVTATGFNGTATKLARDGNIANPMTFNWSGKDGQPSWLWGGEDGSNMYVYNPSKFNVNSAKTATSADSAKKLTTNAGSATNPVYFSNGVPVATTYTLGKSVPSNAVFTDTNTWRGIQDNLTSTATDQSLSANQGKVLKGLVDGKAPASHTHKYASGFSVSGTTVTVSYGDGSSSTFKTQDTNTDNKVLQTAVKSSDYTNWRTLIWGASNNATEGFEPANVTDSVFASSSLTCQPSTGTIRATMFKGNLSGTATNATNDAKSQAITGYIRGLSVSGRTITYTRGDGTTGTITTQDTNTTYSVFKGATSSAAGGNGLVPAPASGATSHYLKSTGAWGQVAWGEISGKPSTFAPASHTHNYAGSSSAGGSANSAVKLDTTTAGSATQPVYFANGKPTACTYTLGKSVPSNAVFTDTHTLTLADRVSGKVVTCDAIPTT